jgi:hypothetical protein
MMGLCFDKTLPLGFVFVPFPCYSKAERKRDMSRGRGAMKILISLEEVNEYPFLSSSVFNDFIFSSS